MRRWADYDGYFGVHTKLHTAKGKAMSIGIYLRVSSNKGQDTRSQEPDLETWGKAQPEEIVWYKDRFTGTTMDRPGLERLLADARGGKVTKLCVWRLDRLGRTANGLLNLLEELQALDVGFVSLREGIHCPHPHSGHRVYVSFRWRRAWNCPRWPSQGPPFISTYWPWTSGCGRREAWAIPRRRHCSRRSRRYAASPE
jgi:hypothetical protein